MYSIIQNRSKGSIHKPAKFIAPGHLSKARVYGPKTSRIDGNSNSHSTSSGTSLQFKDQEHLYTSNHKVDGISTHTLIVDFGEHQLKESDFTEDSSMLDILKMCKKFIDVNSVGYKVMNGDGRPLRNDRDVLDMFKEHEFVENIDVYVEFDDAAKLLPFKLPDDSSTIGSLNFAKPFPFKLPEDSSTIGFVSKVPEVRDASILDEYK